MAKPKNTKIPAIVRIHNAAMAGINSREELFEELQRIQEKTSRKSFQQRSYLFWYAIEMLQREAAEKENNTQTDENLTDPAGDVTAGHDV